MGNESFETFARARAPVLVRTAVALCGDPHLAEDLVQDVLIKVHRDWRRIDGVGSRDAYVRRMLVNEFLSWRRKWGRVLPFRDVSLLDVERVPARDQASHHADRQLLRQEIERLPRRRQVVLALRYYADLSDVDIADALGCSVGTVRAHASRALAALRIEPVLRSEYARTVPPAATEPNAIVTKGTTS